mgnify:CR=1 FL=1
MKRSGTLTRKLAAVTVLFTVILLICVAVCYLIFYRECVEEQAVKYTQESLDAAVYEMDARIAALMDSQTKLSYQSEVAEFLSADTVERFEHRKAIRSLLNSYVNNRDMVQNVFLRSVDGTRIAAEVSTTAAYYEEFRIFRIVTEEMYLSRPFRETKISGVYTCRDDSKVFCAITPVYAQVAVPQERDYLGALVSVCATNELGSFLSSQRSVTICENGSLVYTNQTGNKQETERFLTSSLKTTGWDVTMAYSLMEVGQKLNEVATICLILAGVILFGQTCLFFTLYRSLLRPVKSISDQANGINTFTDRVVEPANHMIELHCLTSSINNMLQRIENFNQAVLAERAKQYEATILLLQTQINPHFLYNNLQCIRGMAADGDDQAIREMVGNIAAIYRYCSQSSSTATLAEEKDCAQMYMRIMELRYDTSYHLELECAKGTLQCLMPRMVLQPLMENSIRHGFKGRPTGTVWIRAWQEKDWLVCTVKDDGCGMSPEELEKARLQSYPYDAGETKRYHIGLGNVRSRIRLIFGESSGLYCNSAPEQGTTVTMKIQQKK